MDDPRLSLRMADAEDAPAMLRVIHTAFSARPPVDPPAAALTDGLLDVERAMADGVGVIAEIDHEMVGCLLLSLDATVAGLHRVSVIPRVREHGVAAALVRGAIEVACDLGARRVELLCRREFPNTLRWWKDHGFEEIRAAELGTIMGIDLPTRVEAPDAEAMHEVGRRLAGLLRAGDLLVAAGELGAGKTTLTQGIAAGLDVSGAVISPTFVLSRIHHPRGSGPALVHVDAYRLATPAELDDLDLDATLADSVTVIEWGTGLAEGLAASRLDIDIRRSGEAGDETRVVYLTGLGTRWHGVDLHRLAGPATQEAM